MLSKFLRLETGDDDDEGDWSKSPNPAFSPFSSNSCRSSGGEANPVFAFCAIIQDYRTIILKYFLHTASLTGAISFAPHQC